MGDDTHGGGIAMIAGLLHRRRYLLAIDGFGTWRRILTLTKKTFKCPYYYK